MMWGLVWIPRTIVGWVVAIVTGLGILGAGAEVLRAAFPTNEQMYGAAPLVMGLMLVSVGVGSRLGVFAERQLHKRRVEADLNTWQSATADLPQATKHMLALTANRLVVLGDAGIAALVRRQEAAGFDKRTAIAFLKQAAAQAGRTAAVEASLAMGMRLASRYQASEQRSAGFALGAATLIDVADRNRCASLLPEVVTDSIALLSLPPAPMTEAPPMRTPEVAWKAPRPRSRRPLRRSRQSRRFKESSEAPTKVCPDCAETVLRDARVCRFCRYEFWGDN